MKVHIHLAICLLSILLIACSSREGRHHQFIAEVVALIPDSTQGLPAGWMVDFESYVEARKNDTSKVRANGDIVYVSRESQFDFFQKVVRGHWFLMQTDAQRLGWKVGSVVIDSIGSRVIQPPLREGVFEYAVYVSRPCAENGDTNSGPRG